MNLTKHNPLLLSAIDDGSLLVNQNPSPSNSTQHTSVTQYHSYDTNYYQFDDLISKELNDLDIPLPITMLKDNSNHNDQKLLPSMIEFDNDPSLLNHNINENDLIPDLDWNQLQLDVLDDSNFQSINNATDSLLNSSHQRKKSHKRGPSGTAIFGFTNHNKTLSISSLANTFPKNPYTPIDLKDNNLPTGHSPFWNIPQHSINIDQNSNISSKLSGSLKNSDINESMTHSLIKQQENLLLALEKQKKLNKKLEQQLLENRLEQQKLETVFKTSYDKSVENTLNNHTTGISEQDTLKLNSRENDSTPLRPTSISPSRRIVTSNPDDAIIVTTDSKTGKYQFPPPNMVSPPPMTNTLYNGSPAKRGVQKSRSNMDNSYHSPIPFSLKYPNSIYSSSDMKDWKEEDYSELSNSFKNTNNKLQSEDPIAKEELDSFNYQQQQQLQLQSSIELSEKQDSLPNLKFFNKNDPSTGHYKNTSIFSTASTIPQIRQDDSYRSSDEDILGLGIQMPNQLLNIETPPTQNNEFANLEENLQSDINDDLQGNNLNKGKLPIKYTFQNTPIKNLILFLNKPPSNFKESNFKDPNLLGIDPYMAPTTPTGLSQKYPAFNNNNNHNIQTPKTKSLTFPEAENSQIITNEYTNNLEASPIKITRKLTTLPRGSIDKYVKELPDKLFECLYPKCHKIFKRRYNIRSHIQTHLEDRPYICDFDGCNKAFVRNHDLVRHKKSHGDKILSCKCGKKFANESDLIIHKNKIVCQAGKDYDNAITKKSPKKKFGTPGRLTESAANSPTKAVDKTSESYILFKMEEQLRLNIEQNGILQPPKLGGDTHTFFSSPPSPELSNYNSSYNCQNPFN
ncbi:hypothetical protein TBLA_0A03960 [Henningerozyma blattae CBS 6284]|uniref:C2H2-type domain-containing protein n=1 Tax=Henningerozyma blattae (strain ATCC 34711 / CBS 6284 / DSM 70876 / NBRC 10599 / NRRL Y-10934 / UCD 77-7) TaxID=1071380 RepID=I2GVP2_HENB6|nr:hypothetical protein TBLA_0A03960 [Tetrapisispora blattae CBS 6284]CCH58194.1 hypothetical protein TBLA_0A03960 [Tetrapisispora blattae CBS 6284]